MADQPRRRIVAIDVLRGLAIVGMLLVNDAGIPDAMPRQLRHAPWQGLTAADLVFPLFLFTVGASMPFSRRAQRPAAVLRRVGGLVVLGSLLVSAKQLRLAPSTGVLQQIAGAYLLAWLALKLPRPAQLPAGAAVLVGLGSNALAAYAASVLLFAFLLKPWQADLVLPLDRLGGPSFAAAA